MADYISKQRAKDLMGCCLASAKAEYKAAKDEFTKARFEDYISTIQAMIDVVGAVEAADVQPVKHGRWEKDEKRNSFEKFCSICKHEAYWDTDYGQQLFDYCPYCGARMDGDTDA